MMRRCPARVRAGWALRREGTAARGFSVLEVLIALALVMALAALAWPTIGAAGGLGAAREAEGMLAAAALRAKAEASLRGEVMELWAEGDGGRTLMVRQAPARQTDESGSGAKVGRGPGVKVGVLPVAVFAGGEVDGAARPDGEASDEAVPLGEDGALLAVFWPGGVSELHGAWSMRSGGHERRAGMNPWTGAMTFADAPAKATTGEVDAEKDETGSSSGKNEAPPTEEAPDVE